MTEQAGTFLVTDADDGTAVLRHVGSGQVHPLASNPGLSAGEVVEGTVRATPPLEVTWELIEVETRRRIEVVRSDAPPTERSRAAATALDIGELLRLGTDAGEIHVLAVAPGRTADVMRDVENDEGTLTRAARLGADRVEIRGADGVVSVRYRVG